LDHGLHVLKLRSIPLNCAPKMRERHQLLFGLRLVRKEFQHPAIQTKIHRAAFWQIFSANKSAPANRKTGSEFYANRDPNKQEIEVFSNIQEGNLKIKNRERLMSFARPIQRDHSHVDPN
jgi:hypothetical protein